MIALIRRSMFWRFTIAMLLGCVFGYGISEGGFALLRNSADREPKRVELTIPAGTATRVAGGTASQALPGTLLFVAGDVLVINNQDNVSHQLGPLWIQPGSTASLNLIQPNEYSYSCTFQPSRYQNLDVRARVTLWVKIQAMLAIGIPSGIMLGLYSLVVIATDKQTY
jgi:hypothetical protein